MISKLLKNKIVLILLVFLIPVSCSKLTGSASNSGSAPAQIRCVRGATVFTTGMSASNVIGQANFTTSTVNAGLGAVNASGFAKSIGVTVINSRLFLSDANNNRVLVYNSIPMTSGVAADYVIGQTSFTTNAGGTSQATMNSVQNIGQDGVNLIVAEWSNNRLSFWNNSNLATGMLSSFVWGQANFNTSTANAGGLSASSLMSPTDVVYAGGKYFVADAVNNRVLIYSQNPAMQGATASVVVGQSNMSTNASGSGLNQLNFPLGVASDGTRLVISDAYNDRVLIFNSIPTINGASADIVLGGYGADATHFNNNVGVATDGKKLFLSDRGNHRVLVWNTFPSVNYQPADVVIGQPDMSGNVANVGGVVSAATLYNPHFLYYDGCQLIVADRDNNRFLIY